MRPWVAARVERLRDARDELVRAARAAPMAAAAALSGGTFPGRDRARATVTYLLTLQELEERDVIVRDLDRGLVDFPAVIGGQEGYLCWLTDEPDVGHWHALGAGYSGRRPL